MFKSLRFYILDFHHNVKKLWFRLANVSSETPASDERVRKVGLMYSVYRFVAGAFLLLMSYSINKAQAPTLPTFSEAMIVSTYLLVGLFLLLLFYILQNHARRQLFGGFFADIIFLTAYSLHGSISELQLALLYMIIVAASFTLLYLYRAVIVITATIIVVAYQQFFYEFDGGVHFTPSDSVLLSICLVAVGFVSWSISQRLAIAEQLLTDQAKNVEKLNIINDAIVRNMVNGIIVLDQNRDIVSINTPAQQLLRLPVDSNACDSPAKIFELSRMIVQMHPELIQWYRTINPSINTSFSYQLPPDKDNPSDKLRINSKPLTNYGQILIIEDIGREQGYAQTLKLASLGGLSASIAHEIRNPLGAISQASQLLLEETAQDEYMSELCNMILNHSERANKIIEGILSLSRQKTPEQEAIKIHKWLQDFIVQHYPQKSICVNVLAKDEAAIVYFDPSHLEQIMINLVGNALRHTKQIPNQADVEIKLTTNEDNAFIDIIDNGKGISEESLSRLFHPFFTTSKQGTGLGLYLSQSYSEANNAKIRYLNHDKSCFRLIASIHRRTIH